ncbi:MAG: HlyC/CorC family transporter [Proteobacteria bacterium]|nr:HlyC/CorC family transporter [Pseudomonadota bacterium]
MENSMLITADFDAAFWITVFSIVALLVLSAFFSGSETALTAARRGKLHRMAEQGSRGARRALTLTDNSERLIGSVLLGNNLVNILATALATSLFTRLFGDNGIALATLVMTFLVLIFAEVLPKTYAITNAEAAATTVSAPIRVVVIFLSPIVAMVRWLVRGILYIFGVKMADKEDTDAAQEEIAGAISLGHVEGNFEKDDRDRLLGALDLKDREVEEIMLHRSDIEMIDADETPQNIMRQCLASPYTRMPVFKDNTENIVGVIHSKDLLRAVEKLSRNTNDRQEALDKLKIMDVVMKPYFVPETTALDDQMRQFLRRRTHFAIVVDEYGALQGLITLEDILEEIVGEITDEHDQDVVLEEKKDTKGNYTVDGAATIRDLNRSYGWRLPDEEAITVAGLVIHEAQMIPSKGQVFSFHGYRFQIMEREQNRITKLKVRPL